MQRANTTDDFPKRSSLIRLAGVRASSITAAEVTEEALSSIETCNTSFGSRARKTSVSTICSLSRLKEYCTVEKKDWPAKSRLTRTKSALAVSEVVGALFPAIRGFAPASRTERPRSTSKSRENEGLTEIRDRAEAISCFSSGEGAHTFSMLTLTCGFDGVPVSCAGHSVVPAAKAMTIRIFRNTAEL